MSKPGNLAELIDMQCGKHADFDVLTCVDFGQDGRLKAERRSFGQLRSNARHLAAWLQGVGVKPGDHIAMMMNNHPEFVETMVASALVGAVFVPIDPRSLGDKLAYMLNLIEAKVIVAADYALAAIGNVAAHLAHTRTILVIGQLPAARPALQVEMQSYRHSVEAPTSHLFVATPDPSAPMFMMFTSGTTGHPKAVVRSHGAHMAGIKGLRALGVQPGDRLYTGLPLSLRIPR